MNSISEQLQYSFTNMPPLVGHIVHLRHLCNAKVTRDLLMSVHGFSKEDAIEYSPSVASFIEQGINFHDASHHVQFRVKPVLQYYAYLNFAVAAVLCFRPNNWHGYKSHGAEDLTKSASILTLGSRVVKVTHGAISLFHAILSDAPFPKGRIALKSLLMPITMLGHEMDAYLGEKRYSIHVRDSVEAVGAESAKRLSSTFTFVLGDSKDNLGIVTGYSPWKQLETAIPMLTTDFHCAAGTIQRTYRSIQQWTDGNIERAKKFHVATSMKMLNFGGQSFRNSAIGGGFGLLGGNVAIRCQPIFHWVVAPRIPIVPTLSAGLVLAFVLASLSRYRPNLMNKLEESKLHVFFDVFTREADGFMIPALRNLIYRQFVCLGSSEVV